MGDIDTVVVDSLKALDLKRPIREADIDRYQVPNSRAVRISNAMDRRQAIASAV